jgi:hypothetical protein
LAATCLLAEPAAAGPQRILDAFTVAYGTASGVPEYRPDFDYNDDGVIDADDLDAFGLEWQAVPDLAAWCIREYYAGPEGFGNYCFVKYTMENGVPLAGTYYTSLGESAQVCDAKLQECLDTLHYEF